MTTTPTPADEKMPGLREQANRLLSDMAADARGDEPHLPLPPLPDGWADGFIDGYVEGALSAAKSAPQEAQVAVGDRLLESKLLWLLGCAQSELTLPDGEPCNRSHEFWSLVEQVCESAVAAQRQDGQKLLGYITVDKDGDKELWEPNNKDGAVSWLNEWGEGSLHEAWSATTPPREVAAVEPDFGAEYAEKVSKQKAVREALIALTEREQAESPARQGGAVGVIQNSARYGVAWLGESHPLPDGTKLYTRAESPSLPVSVVRDAISHARACYPHSHDLSRIGIECLARFLAKALPESDRHLLLGK